jgi:hypothetical protein
VRCRIAMAIHTPRHRQRRHVLDLRHLIDATMARLTPDTLAHMNRVIDVKRSRAVASRVATESADPSRHSAEPAPSVRSTSRAACGS